MPELAATFYLTLENLIQDRILVLPLALVVSPRANDHMTNHVLADALVADGDPKRPVARSSKSERKRHQIIRAAIDIINEKSYALATMTEIAAALDLRDATLYYYFPSKQALAYACHCRSLETFERLLGESNAAGGSGVVRLERFLYGMIKDADRHGAQIYLGDYTYLEPKQRSAIAAWVARLTAQLETFLKDGIRDGSVISCETELAVQLLVGTLVWLAKWAPTAAGMTTERLTRAIRSFALEGLATEQKASGHESSPV